MKNLDDIEAIKKLDAENVVGSIEQIGLQCQQVWEDVKKIPFPDSYKKPDNIVFAGMGGSALGAYVIKSLFKDELGVPFDIYNDYHMPQYVSERTLVIICSYSGTTEEPIQFAKEALEKKAMVIGIAVGKTLVEVLKNAHVPVYIFDPRYNPSNQPRLGTGYTAYSQFAMLAKLGLISVTDEDTAMVVSVAEVGTKKFGLAVPVEQNPAKLQAQRWFGKIPVIVASEFLREVGRVLRNQFHECAKAFAAYHDIPELNHHLMEALTYPETNKRLLSFLFLRSNLYSPVIQKRFAVTEDVVTKQGIHFDEFVPSSKTKISQVFETIQYGAYVNYYMALLYNVNPSKIPWVEYFKDQLAKSS